jgi:hypothetical protein
MEIRGAGATRPPVGRQSFGKHGNLTNVGKISLGKKNAHYPEFCIAALAQENLE